MSECVLSTSMSPCRGEEEEIYSEQLADKGAERLLFPVFYPLRAGHPSVFSYTCE